MKSFILSLLIIFLLSFSLQATDRYIYLETGIENESIYIDTQSISQNDNTIKFWVKSVANSKSRLNWDRQKGQKFISTLLYIKSFRKLQWYFSMNFDDCLKAIKKSFLKKLRFSTFPKKFIKLH